ncbi:MFS transporter [Paenibacillus tyrfis]|uniref:Fucose permease n=1 Tax=Paenibacillus tyrfis TaxID=1501230 RepID=A0A081NWH1_9BACL|nr:MFS transporter [Paenibacillus tyrfis]KEQ22794.1 fucose permease [Paenibacillus tyrfis]
MKRLFVLSCLFYLLIGITSVMTGPLLPEMLPYYERGYGDGGTLLFLQFAGFLVGVLASPGWAARIGKHRLLSVALISIAVPYAVMGFLPGWLWMVLLTLLVGFGSGIIESTIGAFTIEFAEQNKAIAMTQLDVYFGVGALLMPAAISLLIAAGWWPYAFMAASAFTFVLLALWLTLPGRSSERLRSPNAAMASSTSAKKRYTGGQFRLLAAFVVFFFVYMGLELGLMNFLPSILVETVQIGNSTASLGVTSFWIAMVVGRLFAGKVAERMSYVPFLLWSAIGTLVFITALTMTAHPVGVLALILGIGLTMSGLFSIALVHANILIPGMTERTTSILIASGGIGGSVLQWFIGWSMARWSAGSTLWLLMGFTLILLLSVVLSFLWKEASQGSLSLQAGNRFME